MWCVLLLGLWLVIRSASPPDAPAAVPTASIVRARYEASAGARVFARDALRAGKTDLARDPNPGAVDPHLTSCTFVPTEPTGTTPKFDCKLNSGEKIKVKYGWTREIPAEVVATRLLAALGFGADRMSHVEILRCYGFVVSPFHVCAR